MEYHLYRSDVLGNIKTYYCSFYVAIDEAPFDVAQRNLLNDINNDAYFDSEYTPMTANLFIAMCIPHAIDGEQKRFQYFILSKDGPSDDVEEVEETYKGGFTNSQIQKKDPFPLEMWELMLLGDIRREGDLSQISFYVGPDDDPIEKATNVLRRVLENSNSKITAASSFKHGTQFDGKTQTNIIHGTMHYDEDMDLLVVYEFCTQFDGKTQTNIVNVYEVKKVY